MRVLYNVLFGLEKHTEGTARFRKATKRKEGAKEGERKKVANNSEL